MDETVRFGSRFKYTDLIPSKYRIPRYMENQSSRMKLGLNKFNHTKSIIDIEGFSKAIEIVFVRKIIKAEDIPMLKAKFYRRIAKTMERQNEKGLVEELLKLSKQQENEPLISLTNNYFQVYFLLILQLCCNIYHLSPYLCILCIPIYQFFLF